MVNERGWYPVQHLAMLGIGGVRSPEGWRKRAVKGEWPSRDIPGRGGRSGKQRIYRVPESIQAMIDRATASKLGVEEPAPEPFHGAQLAGLLRSQRGTVLVNTALLARLLDEIQALAPEADTMLRLSAAFQAYRALRESALPEPINIEAYLTLDQAAVVSAAALGLSGARLVVASGVPGGVLVESI